MSSNSTPASQVSISKSSLMKMLGLGGGSTNNAGTTVTANQKQEEVPQSYQSTNRGMAQRTQQLKIELATNRRQTEMIRFENERLRKRIRELEAATDEEKLELILTDRLKQKVGQLVHIAQRTMSYVEKAKEDFESVLAEIGVEDLGLDKENFAKPFPPPKAQKISLSSLVNPMNKVEESPVKLVVPPVSMGTITSTVRRGRSTKVKQPSPESPDPDATPKVTMRGRKRKEEYDEVNQSISSPSKMILCTPRVKASTLRDIPPETPMDVPNPFLESDTVRRKRSAATKIKSFALPSLNQKMRRPGKNDEPCPYIS